MSKIRIGIIGAGSRGIMCFGTVFTKNFAGEVELVGLSDPNRERAEAGLASLGSKAQVHTDMHDMLARKDLDAVVVTTPDFLHEECCVAAFKAGKHVLVDKPLAITAKGCLRVVEASRKAGKVLYMGFNMRHDVVIKELKRMVTAGEFGEVFSIQAVEHYNGGRTFMSRWNRLKRNSGGLWIHKGSHDFDVINWLLGGPRPVRVSCFANVFTLNPKHLPFPVRKGVKPGPTCTVCRYLHECADGYPPNAESSSNTPKAKMFNKDTARADGYYKDLCMYLSDKDTHDQGIALVEYDNGATAMHSECFVTPLTNRKYVLDGTGGHAEADLHAGQVDFMPRWTSDHRTTSLNRTAGSHGGTDPIMCGEFIRCIQRGLRPSAGGIDGAWSVAVGEAAEIARVEKRVVKVSEVLDVKSSLLKAKESAR